MLYYMLNSYYSCVADAGESSGESDVREALLNKAEFLSATGHKVYMLSDIHAQFFFIWSRQ